MTITNGYCTLVEARAQIGITESGDTTDDTVIEQRVEAISRQIDKLTGRRFYRNSTDETRVYTATDGEVFDCPDDIGSITTLKTDEDQDYDYDYTWSSSTDYWLEPVNASLDGVPYTRIRKHPTGNYTFPANLVKGVQIVGKFGYAATTPPEIKAACLLAMQRLFKRRDAPFGIAGTTELGEIVMILRTDPDIMRLLYPFMRHVGPV